ncbi:MAG: isochorismate synthase [Streptococcaceae bacterium]|jgi:menaquinone-specific isochorismate synthase|nr:isochorismate synthase [Streptococcaceae bacterium]
MPTYHEKSLTLASPLAFWAAFSDTDERVFLYDTVRNEWIVACERLSALSQEDISNFPYVFYHRPFFNGHQKSPWWDFSEELIAFKHLFIVKSGEQRYLYTDTPRDIPDFQSEMAHDVHLQRLSNDEADFKRLVTKIQKEITAAKLVKVVAAREVIYKTSEKLDPTKILTNLIAQNPKTTVFAYEKSGKCFLGATPELLVEKSGTEISTMALAGTSDLAQDPQGKNLSNDAKNAKEQSIVANEIKQRLATFGDNVQISEREPLQLANVTHLKQTLSIEDTTHGLLDWTKILHPTPALGGEPNQVALELLQKEEAFSRGMYGAPLGFINQHGDGRLWVGIRSALLAENRLYAYAGAGIVAESQAESEFQETELKLQTIERAIHGNK